MRQIRRPECDGAVLVAEVDDGVVRVLAHGRARAELGAVLGDDLARRSVLVFEPAGVTLTKRNER